MGSWPPWWPTSRGQSRPGPTSHELPDPGGEDVVPGEGVDGGLATPGAPGLLPRLGEEAPDHLQEDARDLVDGFLVGLAPSFQLPDHRGVGQRGIGHPAQDDGVERQVQVPVHPRLLFLAVEVDPLEFGVEEPRLLESFVLRNHDPRLPSAGPVRIPGASQRGGGLRGSAPLFLYRDAGGRRGRGGPSAGAVPPDRVQDLLPGAAPELEEEERIPVERLAQDVVGGRHVFTGVGPVGAGAGGVQVLAGRREEAPPGLGEDRVDVPGHLARQELGGEDRLSGHEAEGPGPRPRRERPDPDRHRVGDRAGPRDPRPDGAGPDVHVVDASGARVGPAPREPVGVLGRHLLQGRDPPLAPPGGARLRDLDPVLGRRELRRRRRVPPGRGPPRARAPPAAAHGFLLPPLPGASISSASRSGSSGATTASPEREKRSRSALSSSSVIQRSPAATMREARSRFSSSMRSTFSSTVPAVTSLCTWTARVWPILYVRSVAWSSTAGFHQRSKWNTWVAAVRLRPIPPARRERTKTCGPRPPSWKRRTMASRAERLVPPWRNRTSVCRTWPRWATRRSPISRNCVKTSARSPEATTSSSISWRRASFPDRPGSGPRSPR